MMIMKIDETKYLLQIEKLFKEQNALIQFSSKLSFLNTNY
jgi:hypothetical protein